MQMEKSRLLGQDLRDYKVCMVLGRNGAMAVSWSFDIFYDCRCKKGTEIAQLVHFLPPLLQPDKHMP